MVISRGWEKGEPGDIFNGYRISVLDDKVLKINSGNGYKAI